MSIEFDSCLKDNPLLKAIHWMQGVFLRKQTLTKQEVDDVPTDFMSKRIKKHIQTKNDLGEDVYLMNRYEITVYQQFIKQIETGTIHIKDSVRYRLFADDIIAMDRKDEVL